MGQWSESDRIYTVAEFGIIHEVYTRLTRIWKLEPRFQKTRELVANLDSLHGTTELVIYEAVKMLLKLQRRSQTIGGTRNMDFHQGKIQSPSTAIPGGRPCVLLRLRGQS